MEIVPVSPFDAVAAEAKPPQGLNPEGPFRDCLGAAMCHKQGGGPQSSSGAKMEPTPERTPAGEGGAADPVAIAPPDAEAEPEGNETDEVGELVAADPALAADLPSVDAAPTCEEVPAPPGEDTAITERAAAEPVAVPVPVIPDGLRETRDPATVGSPVDKPLVKGTPAELGAQPIPSRSPAELPIAGPGVGESQATEIQETQSPGLSAPALGADPAVLAEAVAQQMTAGEVRPDAVAPEQEDSQPESSRAGQIRARAAVAFKNQVGAERLWGYWLRGGGAAASRMGSGGPHTADEGPAGEKDLGGGPMAPAVAAGKWTAVAAASLQATGAEQGQGVDLPPSPTAHSEVETIPGAGTLPAQQADRTTPAAGVVSRPPPAPPQPPQQIANAVRIAVLQGGDRVTLQLEPETLGKVHVVLMHSDEGVRANFRVESPLTQQALQADTALLKQALEARGVNIAHVSVELDQGDQQTRDPLGRNARGHRRRLADGQDDAETLLDDVGLRPELWRPWGFEARV